MTESGLRLVAGSTFNAILQFRVGGSLQHTGSIIYLMVETGVLWCCYAVDCHCNAILLFPMTTLIRMHGCISVEAYGYNAFHCFLDLSSLDTPQILAIASDENPSKWR
jgi:hypothetical protein